MLSEGRIQAFTILASFASLIGAPRPIRQWNRIAKENLWMALWK